MDQRFEGKTVIVTGSSSGIGEAVARRFSKEGANVVLVSRTREKLDKVAADLAAERTLVQVCDVSDEAQVQAMVAAAVARFGGLDVLVSNAGTAVMKDFADTTTEDWKTTLATDLDAVFYGAKAALPHLIASKGCIVHTASVSGLGGDWGMSAYNAAKGGVVNFTRALALDLGKHGVRVNAVAPSFTATDLTADMLKDPETIEKFNARMPLGAPEHPDDIAGPVLFLACEDARKITGVILPVDGGVMASNGQPA